MEHEHCNHDHCHHSHSHAGIKSGIHDGAIVISGDLEIQGSLKIIKDKVESELKSFGKWVEEKGGIVGHIKAYINGQGLGYMLSFTIGEVQCKEVPPVNVNVNIVAIVFNVDLHDAECRFAEIFDLI